MWLRLQLIYKNAFDKSLFHWPFLFLSLYLLFTFYLAWWHSSEHLSFSTYSRLYVIHLVKKSRFAQTLRCFWTNKITMRAENTHTRGKQNLIANVKNISASGRSNLRKLTFVKIWIFPPITFFIFISNVETNYEIVFDYIQFGNWKLAFSFFKLFFLILIDNSGNKILLLFDYLFHFS